MTEAILIWPNCLWFIFIGLIHKSSNFVILLVGFELMTSSFIHSHEKRKCHLIWVTIHWDMLLVHEYSNWRKSYAGVVAKPKITTAAEPLLLNAVCGEDAERPSVWLMRQAGWYMKAGLNRDLWITILMFMAHFLENLFRCLFYKTSITYTKKKKIMPFLGFV